MGKRRFDQPEDQPEQPGAEHPSTWGREEVPPPAGESAIPAVEQPRAMTAAPAGSSTANRAVQVVNAKQPGGKTLIEWEDDGVLRRGLIDSANVQTNNPEAVVSMGNMRAVESYGLEWEKLAALEANPESIAQNLRNAGIWTLEDLQNNPQAALGAIQAAYRLDYHTLLRRARDQQNAPKE